MTSPTLLWIPHNFLSDKSLRLCTLWDMISTPTYKLVNHAFGLQHMYDDMKHRFREYMKHRGDFTPAAFSESDKAGIASMNANMRPWLLSHELSGSVDRLDRVVAYADDPNCHIDDLADQIKTLMEALEDELTRKVILYIPHDDMKFYSRPELWFPKSTSAFPSAKPDIEEACKCYALERYTACVYHSMGVLQAGLYAMAHDLGVILKYPVQMAEWQEVISAVEVKIEPLRQLPRNHPQRDELLSFYSGCAAQFRFLKDAWRNHVAHIRERYSGSDAHTILIHTRDFMEYLSTKLHE